MDKAIIHLQWHGPFTLIQLEKLSDEEKDYGIYQIYGSNPIYGTSTLLYIGKASDQTFATRIKQHEWDVWQVNEGQV